MVRGETKKLTVTVKYKETGEVVDCSAATGILLGLYQDGGKIIQKWSKVSKTGYDDIDVTDADTGVLVVYVKTTNLMAGIRRKTVKLEGVVVFDNSDYPDSKQISIDTDVVIEELEPSIFEGIDPTEEVPAP